MKFIFYYTLEIRPVQKEETEMGITGTDAIFKYY